MYSFSVAGGWQEIADFLSKPEVNDYEKELRLAGFSSYRAFAVGDPDVGSFCIEVYNRDLVQENQDGHQYEFLVSITIGDLVHHIAVQKLPDLITLLREVVPLSASIDQSSIMRSRYNDELDKSVAQGTSR